MKNDKLKIEKPKKKKKRKAFTLIELLAVIIILGILMIIAIPSVTKYINDSKKDGYISTAKELAGATRTLIHSGNLDLNDKDTTYYIDSECIETSNGTKTPYGELRKAYVVVNYSDDGYDYYWISVDETGTGVKKITNVEVLNTDSIESNITEADIIDNLGVDARHNYMIINKENNCSKVTAIPASSRVSSDGEVDIIDYPAGKTKRTLSFGDIIKIGNEEFFFLKYEGNDALLLSRYNLKVGNDYDSSTVIKTHTPSEEGYGLQSSECIGFVTGETVRRCALPFSNTGYWHNKLGEGKKYPDYYVYDSNSNLYEYVENYKAYIESFGVNVKRATVLGDEDFRDYTRDEYAIITNTSYWRGSAYINNGDDEYITLSITVGRSGVSYYGFNNYFGVRVAISI